MQDDERVRLTHGLLALPIGNTPLPPRAPLGAGYVQGVPRLNVPALAETDASLGVAWVGGIRRDGATALPSGLALGSTFSPDLLRRGGVMIAGEARAKGFNVLLAGGINLVRDPRGGRNFEYLGEDPLHSGLLGGAAVAGIQSQRVLSTVKHFALNPTETGRHFYDARLAEPALRMSDLLAFEIAIERGRPGAVMCAYNNVNGVQACGSDGLLSQVLKRDWGFPGFVMSDWGAVAGLPDALAGLDQQSGEQLDPAVFLGDRLLDVSRSDPRYRTRLGDMNRRILRSIYAVGLDRAAIMDASIDFAADAAVAQEVAEKGIVLLRNERGVLPLAASARRIAVIGGHANLGVLSGGGSSQVQGPTGPAVSIATSDGPFAALVAQNYHASSPLAAIRAHAPNAEVLWRDGGHVADAVEAARNADVAVVFATQWSSEGFDQPDLSLPDGQDALVAAVAAANPRTIVVLETGGPVTMPWLATTAAVMEAWYPGARGGEAIARVLFGEVNPSGRLPVTFPTSVAQLPRPVLPGFGTVEPDFGGRGKSGQTLIVDYDIEGADVGYRWFARTNRKALFPFGYGLGYADFEHGALSVTNGATPTARFSVRNTGKRSGADVPQLYLVATPSGRTRRLAGFSRIDLAPGQTATTAIAVDPRILADWSNGAWRMTAGTYRFALGRSAEDLGPETSVRFAARQWK